MSSAELTVFPLHAVLFPGGMLPLRVFEARYVDMTRDCLREKKPFGVCLIRAGDEVGKPAIPANIGCLAQITECEMKQLGVLELKTIGTQRFCILQMRTASSGLVVAEVEAIPGEATVAVPRQYSACARLLERIVEHQGRRVFAEPHAFGDAAWVGYRLAELLPIPLPAKQRLLELTDSIARLSLLQEFLEKHGLDPKRRL